MPTIGIKRDLLFKALGKTYCEFYLFYIVFKYYVHNLIFNFKRIRCQ